MSNTHYVIRGGVEGRERLRILSRVMRPTTVALLDRVGIPPEAVCLDVGCGGGDVTVELARRVAPRGRVVGVEIDEVKLGLARTEARDVGVENVEFRRADVVGPLGESDFDVAYARFLLTHLRDPAGCIGRMRDALRPGGLLVVEDVDFAGSFWYPENPPFGRCLELYTEAARRRGGDPNIGRRLPVLLLEAGFERVGMNVVQPAGLEGEVKLIPALTLINIADAVLADGLATPEEFGRVAEQAYEFARDPHTVVSTPRVVQVWGYHPAV
jgi:SAM-dependent methyltransferase